MKNALSEQEILRRKSEWKNSDFGEFITEKFPDLYPAPPAEPTKGVHPRLLFKKEDIPAIRRALESPEATAAKAEFFALADDETDGTLPPAVVHETGRKGVHNFDGRVLAVLQARALAYRLFDDRDAGRMAIFGIENFILSLDIHYINSDQCREFGYVTYIAACVYDWCYDLLTEEDKFRIIAGIEHRMLRGCTSDTVHGTYGGIKMEVGFPPVKAGHVSGHGCERMILRDYNAFSVAIYDEYPDWWKLIGGRIYSEYMPVRDVYYKSGYYPQGTSVYFQARFISDLFCAWILKALTGANPFSPNMKNVTPSVFCHEVGDGLCFPTGDGTESAVKNSSKGYCAMISSYLFGDRTMRAQAKYVETGYSVFTYGNISETPSEFLILSSDGLLPAEERHENLPTILYNSYPMEQMVVRENFSPDSPVAFMKIGARTTANHDHRDAGTFQIYYKGYLARHTGVYAGYGSTHFRYYHQDTVAHNSLLFFDPAEVTDTPILNAQGKYENGEHYFHSGGQRYLKETSDLALWSREEYLIGTNQTHDSARKADGSANFGYIAGDITPAYPKERVAHAERRMITLIRPEEDLPLVTVVFDRTESTKPTIEIKSVVHMTAEPEIDGNVIRSTVGEGKLTVSALGDVQKIEAIGGPGRAYEVAGKNVLNPNMDTDRADVQWGRVELCHTGDTKADFLTVLCATDKDSDAPVTTEVGLPFAKGVRVGKSEILFFTEKAESYDFAPADRRILFTGLPAGEYLRNGEPYTQYPGKVIVILPGQTVNLRLRKPV